MPPGWRGHGLKPVRHRWDDALSRLDGLAFERLMARYYEAQGYRVEHVGTGGAGHRYDGGIDLKLYRGEDVIVVQCKRHTAYQIPHNDVHQLLGVMHTERADGAIFVTTGEYTDAARRKLEGVPNFQLIDGVEVRRMLEPMLALIPVPEDPAPARWERDERLSGPMVRRPPGSIAGSEPSRRKTAPSGTLGGWRLVVGVAVLGLIWFGLRGLQQTLDDLLRPDVVRQPASQERPRRQVQARTVWSDIPPAAVEPAAPAPLIQWAEPTEAEIRESQRRADEAVRILGDRAPEM